MKYRAWRPDGGEEPGDGFDVTAESAQYAAEEAAEHYHCCRDGWELDWPVVFAVRDESGRVDYFDVEREMVPSFTACQVRERPTRREMARPPFRIGTGDV